MRTVEPSYPRYLTQYRLDKPTGQPECQWNGPSWPFQTSQALTGLANFLDDYPPSTITANDYVHLLRQFTHQHFLSPNHPDIQEDYNPDTGGPIVGLARSHHYAHSTYLDLILGGLIGIRPRADEVLEVRPLLPSGPSEPPIRFFALGQLSYHGHDIGLFYDADGTRYHLGRGLTIFVDGKLASGPSPLGDIKVNLPPRPTPPAPVLTRVDLAVNPGLPTAPIATASSAVSPTSIAEAIDGRLWFFPEIANGWSPQPSDGASSWYAIDLQHPQTIGSVELYFFSDGDRFQSPTAFTIQYQSQNAWQDIPNPSPTPAQPLANGENRITFPPLTAQRLRIVFRNPPAPSTMRLIEVEAFAPARP